MCEATSASHCLKHVQSDSWLSWDMQPSQTLLSLTRQHDGVHNDKALTWLGCRLAGLRCCGSGDAHLGRGVQQLGARCSDPRAAGAAQGCRGCFAGAQSSDAKSHSSRQAPLLLSQDETPTSRGAVLRAAIISCCTCGAEQIATDSHRPQPASSVSAPAQPAGARSEPEATPPETDGQLAEFQVCLPRY